MRKEKAERIQRYYDYFRLAVVILIVGFIVYLGMEGLYL